MLTAGPSRTAAVAVALAGVLTAALAAVAVGRPDPARVGAMTGFSVGGAFPQRPQGEVERDLDAVRDSGASWVRVDVNWALVERERGQRRWDDVDRVVEAAHARRLRVLGLLAYTPGWARGGCQTDKCPPADPDHFVAFARAAAQRYGTDRVAAWEVWNEPNIPSFWAPAPDVEAYAALLAPTAQALAQERPDAVVVSAGLSPSSGQDGGVRPVEYLERLYRAGAMEHVDAVGWHPYSGTALPLTPGTEEWNTFLQMEQAREVMAAHGATGTPVWATEFGVSTGDDERATTEDQQARVVAQGLERLRDGEWPWLGLLLVYSLRDTAPDPDWQQGYGLLRSDGTPKPAFDALRDAASRPLVRPTSTPRAVAAPGASGPCRDRDEDVRCHRPGRGPT